MSGTFPTAVKPESAKIGHSYGTVNRKMMGGNRDGRRVGRHKWKIELKFSKMPYAEYAAMQSFLMQQEGGADTFELIIEGECTNRGTATTAITDATIGNQSVGASGIEVDVTGTIANGCKFKFSNHDKVYAATAERDGNGELQFQPPLVVAVSNATTIQLVDVPFTVRQTRDVEDYKLPQYDVYNATLNVEEA